MSSILKAWTRMTALTGIPQTCSGAGEQSRCWEAEPRATEKRGGRVRECDAEVERSTELGVKSLPRRNPGSGLF